MFNIDDNTDVHTINNLGKTPLHTAAKYSKLGIESFKPLLQKGASVNALDCNGNSPLHYIFHNPSVSIDMIEYLLNQGAYPDSRNLEDFPPLFFVQTSALSDLEKSYATKLLIHYSILKKCKVFKRRNDDWTRNGPILSLDFCEDTQRRLDLITIRDKSVKELIQMKRINIKGIYSLFDLLFDYCYDLKNIKEHSDELMIENVTDLVMTNKYPSFQDMLISCAIRMDSDALIEKLHVYTVKPSSNDIVMLNLECNKTVISFLSKVEVNNFIIAFSIAPKLLPELIIIF